MSMMVQLALLVSIPLIVMLFLTQKPHVAAAAASIFGILFLPAARGFDLPLLPILDHSALPSLISAVMLCAVCWPLVARAKVGQGPEILIVVVILAAIVTNLTNGDPQIFGSRVLSAMQPTDTINDALAFTVRWAIPFVIGRAVTRSADELRDVLMILVWGGLLYLPFALLELITGPNFHKWVYGAHPNPYTYSQQVKFGGFRPVVFMIHGLNFAFFMFIAASAALILTKAKHRILKAPILPVALALIVMLLPSRTVGVWAYSVIAFPLIAVARPRTQVTAALILGIVVLAYPAVRAAGVVPVDQMYQVAEDYAGEKSAKSMFARLQTEDEILERTQQRMAFGWGGYGRFQIYDQFTGEALSVLDGFWVITIGSGGAVRVLLMFLFMLFPVFSAYRYLGRVKSEPARRMIAGLALIMAIRAADLIPNSAGAEGYLTFLCGSLAGAVRGEAFRKMPRPSNAARNEQIHPAPHSDQVEALPGSAEPEPELQQVGGAAGSGSLGMLAAQGPPVRRSRFGPDSSAREDRGGGVEGTDREGERDD